MCRFLLLFLLFLPCLHYSIVDAAHTYIIAAQKKRQKEWVSGQTPGGGLFSPYMTQVYYLRVGMQRPNQ